MSKDQLAEYSKLAGKELDVGAFMTYVMKYMMDKGIKLDNTEGMIEASVFPVNYFTLKQVRESGYVAGMYFGAVRLKAVARSSMKRQLATCFFIGDKDHTTLEDCRYCYCSLKRRGQHNGVCANLWGTDRHLALFDTITGLKSTYLVVPPCPLSVASLP